MLPIALNVEYIGPKGEIVSWKNFLLQDLLIVIFSLILSFCIKGEPGEPGTAVSDISERRSSETSEYGLRGRKGDKGFLT